MHLSLFSLKISYLNGFPFTGACFSENMIYKNLLCIVFTFLVSPNF